MKIGLCGTMSVGKTTLVKALKQLDEFKDYNFATERSEYLMQKGIPLNTDSTLKGQTIFLAERCGELLSENIITDRTVIDVMAFTSLAKSISISEKLQYLKYASQFIKDYDHIFYVLPDGVDMEDNGVRETDLQYREDINNEIDNLLSLYSKKVQNLHIIKGSTEERIEHITKAVKGI